MRAFSDTLDECGLQDVKSRGDYFTWFNRRQGSDMIFARLDRYVCNSEWQQMFPTAEFENLGFFGSDHRPILMDICHLLI